VRHRIALCVVVGGCGFHSTAALPSDGRTDDTADAAGPGSGSDDGPVAATDCFQKWLDHTVELSDSTVQEITELSSPGNGNDRNPWISPDGLRMYFSRDNGNPASSDVYVASRSAKNLPFGTLLPLTPVNSIAREGRAWPTPDEMMLAVSTDRTGALDIDISTRAGAVFLPPNTSHLTMVNASGKLRADPFLSADGQRLYLTIDTSRAGDNSSLHLMVATRPSTSADFSMPGPVPGMFERGGAQQADPALYADERLLLFSNFQDGETGDLWYATRARSVDGFGQPMQIPGVNTDGNEFDAVLSADGCDLYFASTRGGAGFHLFHAVVTR
jgi:Tol biopolymer transport system component